MATIRVTCNIDGCGESNKVTSPDITVRVCSADSRGSYSYECPSCEMIVTKDAEPRIVELLVTSGVRLVTWHIPDELSELKEGDPINHNDILDFHTLMQRDDWIDTLRKLTPGPGYPRPLETVEHEHEEPAELVIEGSARRLLNKIRDVFRISSDEIRRDGPGGDINNA